MLPIERLNRIKNIISAKKQMDVTSLAQELNVTEVTIRRDLEKLENEHFLTRTHGGAVLNESVTEPISLFQIEAENAEIYENIGKVASQLVNDSEVIFLGPGISTRYIGRYLNNKTNLSVVTTDLMVAHDCAMYSPNVSVIVTSGNLNSTTLQLSGHSTDNFLSTFSFTSSFLDIDGITLERGYSVSSLEKAYLTQDIIKLSQKYYAVCPYINFEKDSSAFVGSITTFDSIISNERTPKAYKEFYFQNNIRIYATFNVYKD